MTPGRPAADVPQGTALLRHYCDSLKGLNNTAGASAVAWQLDAVSTDLDSTGRLDNEAGASSAGKGVLEAALPSVTACALTTDPSSS